MNSKVMVVGCAFLAGCQANLQIGTGTDEIAALAAAAQAWGDAFNRCDAAQIAQLYAPDAALWGTTSQALISTPAGVREYFDKVCAAANPPKVAFGKQLVRVYGDTATNSGSNTFTVVRDGKAVVLPAGYTLAYRKVGGRWLIVDHHSSMRLPPKPSQ